jgi:hypothetical protein
MRRKCLDHLQTIPSVEERKHSRTVSSNTLYLYSAANSGEGLDLPVEGSRNGPTLALTFALDLQKEKNALGFYLILFTVRSGSFETL